MKKITFIFVLILCSKFMLFSQDWFVGASVNFGIDIKSTINDSGELDRVLGSGVIVISPEIGYKLNKLNFGIIPIIDFRYQTEDNYLVDSRLGIGLGSFLRYNLVTFFDKLSVLGRLDLNYIYSNAYNTNNLYNKNIEHIINLSISPVIEYKLTNHLTLYSSVIGRIIALGYTYSYMHYTLPYQQQPVHKEDKSHRFSLYLPSRYNLSLTNISLGFYITF